MPHAPTSFITNSIKKPQNESGQFSLLSKSRAPPSFLVHNTLQNFASHKMGTKQCTITNVQVIQINSSLVYLPITHTLNCRNLNAFSGAQAIPDTVSATNQVCQHSTFDVHPTWKLVLSSPTCHSLSRCVSAKSCSLLSAKNTITWKNSKGSNSHVFIHPPLSLPFSRIYFHQSWQPQFVQIRGQKRKRDPNSHLDNHRTLSSAGSKNESVLSSRKSVSNWYGYFDLKKLNDVNSEKRIGLMSNKRAVWENLYHRWPDFWTHCSNGKTIFRDLLQWIMY